MESKLRAPVFRPVTPLFRSCDGSRNRDEGLWTRLGGARTLPVTNLGGFMEGDGTQSGPPHGASPYDFDFAFFNRFTEKAGYPQLWLAVAHSAEG